MKILKKLLLLGIFSASLSSFAAPNITDQKIKLELRPTPNYKILNGSNITESSKNWLVINLSYKMPGIKSKNKNQKNVFIDNPYIEWEVLTRLASGNKSSLGLVTGKTTYWAIPVDGKVHYAIGLVPAVLLQRYFVYQGDLRSSLNKTIFVRATLYNSQGKSLAVWYSSGKTNARTNAKALFDKIKNNRNAVKIKGGVYPKNKTAWSFINIQKYDLIKEEDEK